MRRTSTTLAALALGAAVALAGAAPALAASGTLTVSGKQYSNPAKGCYTGNFWPLMVNNQTDTPVFVFDQANCTGRALGVVEAGRSGTFEFGDSVLVPR
ncbi:hypothetical protein AB0C84_12290 [Actinomadura sp. NPDC048955]|uniref:hypothetical protein n=1 Tax=Actinomadura sp. NPDC048955 TaxID=3158228 RepID=UPI0033C23F16